MNKALIEFKNYLQRNENMAIHEAEHNVRRHKRLIADCLKTTNINILKLNTSNEFEITMRAYHFINSDTTRKRSFDRIFKLYNQFLVHKTIMEWL